MLALMDGIADRGAVVVIGATNRYVPVAMALKSGSDIALRHPGVISEKQ